MRKISILIHNIRSVHNVGSIFRTADAFGVSKLYISGYTPSPTDRFGRQRADIAKVALGAEKTMSWEHVDDEIGVFVKTRKKAGVTIVVLEQDKTSISFKEAREKISAASEILLIIGNEVGGVERALIELADCIVEIPMRGMKESLNVSVATGIALFELSSK